MSRSPSWKIADLIDFEFLLAGETAAEDGREFYEEHVRPKLTPGSETDRRSVFQAWLLARRAGARSTIGQRCTAAGKALTSLGGLAGLLLGGGVTATLLHYQGSEPVNVATFLGWTVGVQILLLVAAVLIWLARATTGLFEDFHPVRSVLTALGWALSAGLRKLPGEERDRLRATLAGLARRREIYGSLVAWPFLIVTQIFAGGYNLGILAVLVMHVAVTDLAFGWQSTLELSPEVAHRIVSTLAAPWSWFAPNAHPVIEDIVASRFSYNAGIRPLDSAAMASWWPFLAYAVTCYGLLLRGALLVFGVWKMRASLRALAFDHEGCNALYRRLTGPVVQAQNGTAVLAIPRAASSSAAHAARGGACLALVAPDLALPAGQPADYVRKTFGWQVAQSLPVQIDHPGGNAEVLAAAASGALAGVVVVVRARRVPIKAIALCLQKIAESAGPKAEVVVLLVGRADGAGFARVEDDDFTHWRNLQAIHGLRLSVEKWSAA